MQYFTDAGINLELIKSALPIEDEACLNAIQFFSESFAAQGVSPTVINNTITAAIEAYVVVDEPAQPLTLEICERDEDGHIDELMNVETSLEQIERIVDSAAWLAICLRDRKPHADAARNLDDALTESSVLRPVLSRAA